MKLRPRVHPAPRPRRLPLVVEAGNPPEDEGPLGLEDELSTGMSTATSRIARAGGTRQMPALDAATGLSSREGRRKALILLGGVAVCCLLVGAGLHARRDVPAPLAPAEVSARKTSPRGPNASTGSARGAVERVRPALPVAPTGRRRLVAPRAALPTMDEVEAHRKLWEKKLGAERARMLEEAVRESSGE